MIRENVLRILNDLPEGVQLEAAAKSRTPEEILEAVEGGLEIIGENYVQEAERAIEMIGNRVKWHMIGHLQRNKVKKAVKIFDMIETVDSMKLALEIDKSCLKIGRVMPVLIEINSAMEPQKTGVMADDTVSLVREMSQLENVEIMGLMTMGPLAGNPEDARPYFARTRALYEKLKDVNLSGVMMRYLSMGMSHSYRVAIEEGANLVRIGTAIFGPRRV
jgi:pyridoxal phosphate enzyme (YggS family)